MKAKGVFLTFQLILPPAVGKNIFQRWQKCCVNLKKKKKKTVSPTPAVASAYAV